jgi:hypothetical protein
MPWPSYRRRTTPIRQGSSTDQTHQCATILHYHRVEPREPVHCGQSPEWAAIFATPVGDAPPANKAGKGPHSHRNPDRDRRPAPPNPAAAKGVCRGLIHAGRPPTHQLHARSASGQEDQVAVEMKERATVPLVGRPGAGVAIKVLRGVLPEGHEGQFATEAPTCALPRLGRGAPPAPRQSKAATVPPYRTLPRWPIYAMAVNSIVPNEVGGGCQAPVAGEPVPSMRFRRSLLGPTGFVRATGASTGLGERSGSTSRAYFERRSRNA